MLIKYIKSVLWRVAKRLSYIEDAWCLKVNTETCRSNFNISFILLIGAYFGIIIIIIIIINSNQKKHLITKTVFVTERFINLKF